MSDNCDACQRTPPGFFTKYRKFLLSTQVITAAVNTIFLVFGFAFEFSGNKPYSDACFLISAVVGGYPVFKIAVTNILRAFDLTAGVMVSIAMVAALIIGEYGAMALVAFMMIIGEVLEEFTRERAHQALKQLAQLVPSRVTLRRGGEDVEVPLQQVRAGDLVVVKQGARVPVDGSIREGSASIDQSAITGESMPADKVEGEQVFAGTLVASGFTVINVERVGADTTLGHMMHLVEEAQKSQAPVQRVANRYANYFAPIAVGLAAITWFLTGEITRSVTMLVAICPCSLVLATPTAVVAAIGNTAKSGVLVKHGTAMEQLGGVDVVAFDKTGTVTFGEPDVTDVKPLNSHTREKVLTYAASAERGSEHPLAKAIIKKAKEERLAIHTPTKYEAKTGLGIKAVVEDSQVVVGDKMIQDEGINLTEKERAELQAGTAAGYTVIPVAVDGKLAGLISIADTVRPESAKALKVLKTVGVKKTVLITGDNSAVAEKVARELGVDEFHSSVLPSQKLELIQALQKKGHRVAFVGDGVNDAPALAAANIGIAMGAIGTAVAMETADVVLLNDDVMQVPRIIELSQATMRTIKLNIAISMSIVLFSVGASSIGLFGPVIGAIMHEVAAVPVIANAARLISRKSPI